MPPINCTSKWRWADGALGRLAHGGEAGMRMSFERVPALICFLKSAVRYRN